VPVEAQHRRKIGRYRRIPTDACRELVDRLVAEDVA
jgi:hypothetical protein